MSNQLIVDACEITLKHPDFSDDFIQLTKNELALSGERQNLTEEQVSRLLETASLFALSEEPVYQKLASKISVYLLKQYKDEYPLLPLAVEIIMTRLGDLPTILSILRNRDGEDYFSYFTKEQNYDAPSTFLKFPEILVRKLTNQAKVTERISLTLTDSQSRVYSLLKEKPAVAFSAPTSAGKSFVIRNYIAEKVYKTNSFCAVYLAPTKALIAEIQDEISRAITSLGVKSSEFAVFTSVNYLNAFQARAASKSIFVLTQERLQEAIANNPLRRVDLLVVDEAHKISDKSRGVIAEDAVGELISKNPGVQTVFISPYIKDTGRFKLIFGVPNDISSETTSKSPVGQEIFRVDFRGKRVAVSLISNELRKLDKSRLITLGELSVSSNLASSVKKKAWVARHVVPHDEPTIIYCNRPSECRSVAKYIGLELPEAELSEELRTAIGFFSEHVHKDYYLCDSLKNRIGYHYGKMPQFVRFFVKKLFEKKEITLLCCTSTLLEGVNMPAKNIVLYNPKAGRLAMDRLSVLNLAGRAGRLLMDYYGKIYCINLEEWDKGEDVFDDRLENVESSVETTLTESAESLKKYLEDEESPATEGVKTLATSLLMKQLMDPTGSFLTQFRERHKEISQDNIDEIKTLLGRVVSHLAFLDEKVILKNRTMDPRRQHKLYLDLKNSHFEPAPSPQDPMFCRKLTHVFQKISQFLLKEGNERYRYLAGLAWRWVSETPYKTLVDSKITYSLRNRTNAVRDGGDDGFKRFVNQMIDDLDDDLETKIKYEYTRGLKCYVDITEKIMEETGDTRYVCKELPTYLEAGAFNDNALFLLEIGLSRSVAILIEPYVDRKIESALDCITWLKTNKEKVKNYLSAVLYREVETLLSRYEEG